MKALFDVTLKPLTGIHIGTGNSLTPMDYLIKVVNKSPRYITYSSDSIMERVVSDPKKLIEYERACKDNSMTSLYEFFKHDFSLKKDLTYLCDITNAFLREYETKSQKNPLDSSCDVLQMYRPEGKKAAVIPGSSLKGSIRTAMLNQVMHDWDDSSFYDSLYDTFIDAKERNNTKKASYVEKDVQKKIMGKDPKNDLFRTVSIGDAQFSARGSQLVGNLINFATQDYNRTIQVKGIPIYAEVLRGSLMGSETTGSSRFSIDLDLQKVLFRNNRYGSMKSIIQACNYFFKREFFREAENFYDGVDDARFELYGELRSIIEQVPSNSQDTFLVRVGRWSQVEFVTLEPMYRFPKVPKDKGHGNTRTVFDYDGQFLPMGWCLCTVKELEQ